MIFHSSTRVFAHIDCNSFFASCEVLRDPSLAGKFVCVGDQIIIAASYECKKLGVKTGMGMWEAERILRGKLVKKIPDHTWYREVSGRFSKYLEAKLGKVEIFSIDELFADVTDIAGGYASLAEELKHCILHDIGIPVSVGISNTRIRAKMFGELHKPLGSCAAFSKETIEKIFRALPVTAVPYIAKGSSERLGAGIKTVFDFYDMDARRVHSILGKNGVSLWLELHGVDVWQPHDTAKRRKSIMSSRSFNHEMNSDPHFLWRQVLIDFERAYETLLAEGQGAKIIGITLRTREFERKNSSSDMGEANIDRARMVGILKEIFLGAFEKHRTYRTVGVFFEELSPVAPKQLSVFEMKSAQSEKGEHLAAAVEKLKGRFGENTIHLGFLKKAPEKRGLPVLFEAG